MQALLEGARPAAVAGEQLKVADLKMMLPLNPTPNPNPSPNPKHVLLLPPSEACARSE